MFSTRITGFSLIELISVLAIAAILMTLSYAWILPHRAERIQQAALEQMQSQFYSARLFGYRFQQPILICPEDPIQRCGEDWSHAWRFWRDETLVWTTQPLSTEVQVTWQGVHRNQLMIAASQQHAVLAGRLRVDVKGATTTEIIVSRNGDVRSSRI